MMKTKQKTPVVSVETSKLTIGQRIKNTAKRAVAAVKAAATRVVSAVKRASKRVVAVTKNTTSTVVAKVAPFVRKATAGITSAWRVVVRPFLKGWGMFMAAVVYVVALLMAPLPVLAFTFITGTLLVAIAITLKYLERVAPRVANIAFLVVDAVWLVLRAMFYTTTAVFLVATALSSPVSFIILASDLTLCILQARSAQKRETVKSNFDEEMAAMRDRMEIPTVKRHQAIKKIDQDLAVDAVFWEGHQAETAAAVETTERPAPETAAAVETTERPAPGSRALRAIGTEEMRDTPACQACATVELGMRVKSNALPIATCGNGTYEPSNDSLCSECYDAECEDIALSLTGVSLQKTNVELRLNERGLTTVPEYAHSLARRDALHWSTEPTAWWRTRGHDLHAREWTCFHEGKVVARVRFNFRARTYIASVMNRVVGGPQRTLNAAMLLASDILMDERNAVGAIGEMLSTVAAKAV